MKKVKKEKKEKKRNIKPVDQCTRTEDSEINPH